MLKKSTSSALTSVSLRMTSASKWTTATIDDHVAEVRGMYLKALDQKEPQPAPAMLQAR